LAFVRSKDSADSRRPARIKLTDNWDQAFTGPTCDKKQSPGSSTYRPAIRKIKRRKEKTRERERKRGLNRGTKHTHPSLPRPSPVALAGSRPRLCGLKPAHTRRERGPGPGGHGSGSPQLLVGAGRGVEASHSPSADSTPSGPGPSSPAAAPTDPLSPNRPGEFETVTATAEFYRLRVSLQSGGFIYYY
jgi:hypothetical protein